MFQSFITCHGPNGDRAFAILSLTVLRSVSAEQRARLADLGIRTLSDLLHFAPIHRARLIVASARGEIAFDADLRDLVADQSAGLTPAELAAASPEILDGIGASAAQLLASAFSVTTVAQLAAFPPFVEAETLMEESAHAFYEPPSAPPELIPRALGAIASR